MIANFTGIGRLTKDSELKAVGDKQILKLNIAFNPRANETIFMPADMWINNEKQLELYSDLKKGEQVYIQGRLKHESYEANGKEYNVVKIVADQLRKLSANPNGSLAKDTQVKTNEDRSQYKEIEQDVLPF